MASPNDYASWQAYSASRQPRVGAPAGAMNSDASRRNYQARQKREWQQEQARQQWMNQMQQTMGGERMAIMNQMQGAANLEMGGGMDAIVQQHLLAQMTGADAPINPAVQAAMMSSATDPYAAEAMMRQTQARNSAGARGMGPMGGGMGASARNFRSQALAGQAGAGRDIMAKAALANYQARTQAGQTALGQIGQNRQSQLGALGLMGQQAVNMPISGPGFGLGGGGGGKPYVPQFTYNPVQGL